MKVSIITLFPGMFLGPFSYSIIKRAIEKEVLTVEYSNLRDFGIGKHKTVDDTPYGGGAGMLIKVDVIEKSIQASRCKDTSCKEWVILLDAGGKPFTQHQAEVLKTYDHLILIAAHYEGVDDRIRLFIDEELSIGDYVLTGGEIPTMVVVDTVVRLLPNVLGKEESSQNESFQKKLLEYPQYTKPLVYKGHKVPDILLSGHHKNIDTWREKKSLDRTQKNRPDLLKSKRGS